MSIIYNEKCKTFALRAKNTGYYIRISENNLVQHLHFGAYVPDEEPNFLSDENLYLDNMPLEYPASGTGDFREPCLMVMDCEGMSACEVYYRDYKIYKGKPKLSGLPATFSDNDDDCVTLELYCEDPHLNLEITLIYSVFENLDAVTRSVKIKNKSDKKIKLTRVLSACVDFTGKDYDMITLHGSWGREGHVERSKLHYGKQIIDSIGGTTSHSRNNFFAVCENETTEDYGDAYGFCLVYSGNFICGAEVCQTDNTRIFMGINPFDFSWTLEQGEEFQTPEVIMVFSNQGIGGMSRTFHDVIRNHLIRGRYRNVCRPVLINNWEATYFDFNSDKLIQIAKDSAEAGVEMLVMDDGWFGERYDDSTSLGDWEVNDNKIKGGLKKLVDEVNGLGLKFGLWFEPEMVSPESKLYKENPDWCLHINGRARSTSRHQLVLDFSRKEVRNHIYEKIKKILTCANIEYIKWDMNRRLSEVGNDVSAPERQREIWHRYVLGVYEIMERLLCEFPNLLLENCSSGGGRFDAGMLYYSPQIWTSDNTDAIDRLKIQHGMSLCYPCSVMGAHVSACPNHVTGRNTPFKTRGHVALAGTFGYELDVTKLNKEDKNAIKEQISEFKKYNHLVRDGDFYRLLNPFEQTKHTAWQFVSKDKKESLLEYVQVLKTTNTMAQRVRLKGLDENAFYLCEQNGKRYSGKALMTVGFKIHSMNGDFQSCIFNFLKISDEKAIEN